MYPGLNFNSLTDGYEKKIDFLFFSFLFILTASSQQPPYTPKKFVNYFDTTEFKIEYPASDDGIISTYILTDIAFWDTDDNNVTHIMGNGPCLINIWGMKRGGKKTGIFTTYLIDSADHSKRYKVYEQSYKNDRLNGVWKVFNLKGTLVQTQMFKEDSLNGISRTFWIDGKTIMEEKEYFNGGAKFFERGYSNTGKLKYESSFLNDKLDGSSKDYYEDGSIKRDAQFSMGVLNGTLRYYHPGGKLWIEQIFKNGKPWIIVANYDKEGKPREKGTLKDGNGSVYLYNDDGSIRVIETYINGELKG